MSDQQDSLASEKATATVSSELARTPLPRIHNFAESWGKVNGYKSLNQFQRYTTLHLLNLRFLEEELANMESQILPAGLKPSERENNFPQIGFEHAEISPDVCDSSGKVSQEFVEKLRGLIQQYDEALIAFNDIKGMETILLDRPRDHLVGLEERYNGLWVEEILYTRIVKPQSSNTEDNDIIRRSLRKLFVKISILFRSNPQESKPTTESIPVEKTKESPNPKTSPQRNPVRIGNSKAVSIPVEFFTRLFLALVSGALLIAPLTILSFQSTRKAHLTTVAVSTVVFSLLVSLVSKSTNSEIMAAAAGYTAVLVVFFAVAPQSYT